MSVHETASGWQIDRRAAYGNRVRKTFGSKGAAYAFDARLEAEAQARRAGLRRFPQSADMRLGEVVNEYLAAASWAGGFAPGPEGRGKGVGEREGLSKNHQKFSRMTSRPNQDRNDLDTPGHARVKEAPALQNIHEEAPIFT